MFDESEFEAACQEVESPILTGWEFFTQSDSREISIYRRYNEKSGLYAYKIFGTMDVPADVCAQVYIDIDYRKSWDPYIKDIREVSRDGHTGIYWQVNYPFPMSRRDLVFSREVRHLTIGDRQYSVILSRANDYLNDVEPIPKNTVRIRHSEQTVAITKNGTNGARAFSYYYEDPGGLIPSWVINWAAKTGVPALLAATEKGCHEYMEHQKQKAVITELPAKPKKSAAVVAGR